MCLESSNKHTLAKSSPPEEMMVTFCEQNLYSFLPGSAIGSSHEALVNAIKSRIDSYIYPHYCVICLEATCIGKCLLYAFCTNPNRKHQILVPLAVVIERKTHKS